MAPQTSLGNILIVDDEEAITDLLSLNLRSEGYNVAVISRTSEVDLRELRSFHLVIVDGKNQDFTGLSLIKKIKESPVGDMLGIIYCSRIDNERILIDALNAGADDCMRKPFSLRELLARIKAVMRRWTSRAHLAHPKNAAMSHASVQCVSTLPEKPSLSKKNS